VSTPLQFPIYQPEPTPDRFHKSTAFVRGIMGPIGSGKSVACCIELMYRAYHQAAGPDGVRRSRWAVIRNTYPELKSTTIKTWLDWCPAPMSTMNWSAPISCTYRVIRPDDGTMVEAQIYFIALDTPKDIKKLLSLELTGAWINEAREINKQVVDTVQSRLGRYPGKLHGAPITWSGLFLDTNPPDDDHWWYRYAERGEWRTTGHEGEDVDLDRVEYQLREMLGEDAETLRLIEETMSGMEAGQTRAENKGEWEFFRQPSALIAMPDGGFLPNPMAENIGNQQLGHWYWLRQTSGKDREWIQVYILGEYGSVFDGRPVYDRVWRADWHLAPAPIPILPIPVHIGIDFGLTPAVCAFQVSGSGQIRMLREWCCEDGGLKQFIDEAVLPGLHNDFPGLPVVGDGDPAGAQRAQADSDIDCFKILEGAGLKVMPALTNAFAARRESVMQALTRTVGGGEPGFWLDPSCDMLRKGFNGGYKYDRVQVTGDERYHDVPCKNRFSHIHDALQYGIMGLRRERPPQPQIPRAPQAARRAWGSFV